MKHTLTLSLLLLALLGTACRRDTDARDAYERYAVRQELQVALVKDFCMDSIQGDFVVLTAPDTATWFALAKEFGIPRFIAERDSNASKHYIIGYQYRKDPTQKPPKITLPSGEQRFDIEQSCSSVVDVANQKIYLIFAKDEDSLNQIEDKITDNL